MEIIGNNISREDLESGEINIFFWILDL